jgi:hypothetical protein
MCRVGRMLSREDCESFHAAATPSGFLINLAPVSGAADTRVGGRCELRRNS